ncbi:response regulator [Phreatobacter sp. AB_2022a]|uniref:response regulator n=1 Tax=Phreatobacter sp. AB_2022a TaxID=3003134 RepID=UPI0022876068|nr:response regulator [Phreatobacter sp. AB_2022a]MCZ0735634.1 response regulator [Phreatobacter sp. AB_2022a]
MSEPHILLVDDDGEIRRLVTKFLRESGFRVTSVRDGREMRETLKSTSVDLIVLDLMLPGISGLELCRELRAESAIPIVMLTARGDDLDRVLGLEFGADDYISKPFNTRELAARIRAVLRRTTAQGETRLDPSWRFTFDGWVLDTRRRELVNDQGVVVDLSTGEYDLLLSFVEAPQRVLSRDHLLDAARNRVSSVFDRSIDVQVSRLRRKLGGDGTPDMIKTVRGLGYLFVPEVAKA